MQMNVPAVAPEALRSGTGMMKRGGALVTAGVAATAAVLGMHLAGGAGAWPPAAILGLSLFWAALFGVFGRRQSAVDAARWAAIDAQVVELTEKTQAVLGYLARQFNEQFDNVRSENGQVQGILADAIEKLIGSFTGLEEHARRQQEDVAFGDRHLAQLPVLDDLERHVAFELIEQLLVRIDVVVVAQDRPGQDHHHEIAVAPDRLVQHRRLEEVTVVVHPPHQVERGESAHRRPLGHVAHAGEA